MYDADDDRHEQADGLAAEVSRGRRLDRELSHDLGRSAPVRPAATTSGLQAIGRARHSPEDERRLVLAAKSGDAAARAQLVAAFMPQIAAVARNYRSGHVERVELLQEGVVGLLRALEGFDRARGTPAEVPGDGAVGTFGDLIVDPLAEGEYERVLDAVQSEDLHALLAGLSNRERAVLRARYGLDGDEQSLREIGRGLGLSGERVRQIEQRALGKLASAMAPVDAHGGSA